MINLNSKGSAHHFLDLSYLHASCRLGISYDINYTIEDETVHRKVN